MYPPLSPTACGGRTGSENNGAIRTAAVEMRVAFPSIAPLVTSARHKPGVVVAFVGRPGVVVDFVGRPVGVRLSVPAVRR